MTGAYSATNKAIIDAFNGAVSTANANIIVKNLKVIYTQSTLRYVFKFNEDLANGDDWTGNRAEAFAFYNNIAPYVKAADAAGHDAIAAFLDPTVAHSSCNNYHYCKAKAVLKAYDTAVWDVGRDVRERRRGHVPRHFAGVGRHRLLRLESNSEFESEPRR